MTYVLWIIQGLLALLFVFGGGFKLYMPAEELVKETGLPSAFMRFIAVAELLGGLGLVLPGLFRIRPGLTPLAAAGLIVIMVGAVVVTVARVGVLPALMPLVVGGLLVFVAYGRWRLAPHGGPSRPSVLQEAR